MLKSQLNWIIYAEHLFNYPDNLESPGLLPCQQGIDGIHVCAALTTQYCMINSETGQVTDLFPVESEHTNPIVKRISRVCTNELSFFFTLVVSPGQTLHELRNTFIQWIILILFKNNIWIIKNLNENMATDPEKW